MINVVQFIYYLIQKMSAALQTINLGKIMRISCRIVPAL